MITPILRSRGFAALTHAGLWLLLYLVITHIGGKTPPLRESTGVSAAPVSPAPIGQLPKLFAGVTWPTAFADATGPDPFYTRFFVPAPAPAPPPPATTRQITITYQGFHRTGDSRQQVLYKLAQGYIATPVGSMVATNLFIAAADPFTLTLTNHVGRTNLLQLNKPTELEVPIQ